MREGVAVCVCACAGTRLVVAVVDYSFVADSHVATIACYRDGSVGCRWCFHGQGTLCVSSSVTMCLHLTRPVVNTQDVFHDDGVALLAEVVALHDSTVPVTEHDDATSEYATAPCCSDNVVRDD